MSISELRTPIRIYWDLPAEESATGVDCLSIAGQIVGLKILSLDITASVSTPSSIYQAVLERLAAAPMAVSLTLPLAAITPTIMGQLSSYRLKNLNIGLTEKSELAAVKDLNFKTGKAPAFGVSFAVDGNNYHQLPEVYSFCAGNGLSLILPMQRLMLGGEHFALDKVRRQELSDLLKEVVKPEKMQVVIHDPFIWRAFFPTVHFPEGSCQAANTMLSITADGDVYPCPCLPVGLGNLNGMSLAAIAHSTEKQNLRGELTRTPAGCDDCSELTSCYGGCRGRGYCATGSWDEPDPGCR